MVRVRLCGDMASGGIRVILLMVSFTGQANVVKVMRRLRSANEVIRGQGHTEASECLCALSIVLRYPNPNPSPKPSRHPLRP